VRFGTVSFLPKLIEEDRTMIMLITLSDAGDDLRIKRTQDPGRLNSLAQFCINEFNHYGLKIRGGKTDEVSIRGIGRQKTGT
jgi:hypothetical protein